MAAPVVLPAPDAFAERHRLDAGEVTPAVRAALERQEQEIARLCARLEAAETLADQDPLTPVLNRRAFERELARAIASAERYGEPLSLVYFDLNRFKDLNDLFGHAAGDAALQHTAEVLVSSLRGSDIVGRMGGDEFAACLVRANAPDAAKRAAQLAAMIEAAPVRWQRQTFKLSIAHGVRPFEPGKSAAELLAEADAAMYLRKRG
ncbi:MAG: GGDEF domain-containing protein [Proteobacteria bacterium]|nr:GGDEF domain-containing protein [Pseudomonadota bacterium]